MCGKREVRTEGACVRAARIGGRGLGGAGHRAVTAGVVVIDPVEFAGIDNVEFARIAH